MVAQNPVERLVDTLRLVYEEAAAEVFISITAASALEEAKEALDRLNNNQALGPIDGYLIAVKGNVDLAGLENTAGSIAFSPEPAAKDAELVTKLRDAGGIILGHTNMSEFAFSGLGANPHFGTPKNPLSGDAPLVPGGSSSGSASAVSLSIADLAIGSDTSGSIRIPAAFQGLVGYRPSMGRYSSKGVFPLAPSMDTPGSICRTVAQTIALDSVLADEHKPESIDLSEMHFVAPTQNFLQGADSAVQQRFEAVINYLKAAGVRIVRRDLAVFQKTQALFTEHGTLVAVEALELIPSFVTASHEEVDIRVRQRLASAAAITTTDIKILYDSKTKLEQELNMELGDAMLLMPTTPNEPPALADIANDEDFASVNARTLSFTMLGAYLNMPTVALPVDKNVPGASLSIAGIQGSDDQLLALALEVERVLILRENSTFRAS